MHSNPAPHAIDGEVTDLYSDLVPCSLSDLLAALGCICALGLLFAGVP